MVERRRVSGSCQKFPVVAYAALTLVAVGMNGGCSELSTRPTSSPPAPQAKSTVEFHPGYPPAWVKNFKNLPPEVIPGAKLGYSKEESAIRLRPEVREFLDIARRLYNEPGLLAHRQEVLELLHVSKAHRINHSRTMSNGSKAVSFREYFKAGGLFDNGTWTGFYDYGGLADGRPQQWEASLEIEIDDRRDCIDSRAVEGYLDVPINPGLWPPLVNPVPPERWDRHGIGTGRELVTQSSVPFAASIGMEFGNGCLASMRFSGRYDLNRVSNEGILKQ
ncbi:MAG: hypothetical protein ACREYA_01565 [Cupriavidus necator]